MAVSRDFNIFQILHLLECSCWELKATPFYGSDNPDRKGSDPANTQKLCLQVARCSYAGSHPAIGIMHTRTWQDIIDLRANYI